MGPKQSRLHKSIGDIEIFGKPIKDWLRIEPSKPCPFPNVAAKVNEKGDIEENTQVNDEDSRSRSTTLLRNMVKKKLGIDSVNKYNFAFVGRVGVGKSTIINSLRGIFDENDPLFAPVNEYECTQEIKDYQHPEYKNIIFWDCPGGNTRKRPTAEYFFKHGLFAFDHILIVVSDRIMDFDIYIAKQALQYDIPFDFVRSKADNDLDNMKNIGKDKTDNYSRKSEFRKKIDKNFQSQVDIADLNIKNNITLFLVSMSGFDSDNKEKNSYEMNESDLVKFVLEKSILRRNC